MLLRGFLELPPNINPCIIVLVVAWLYQTAGSTRWEKRDIKICSNHTGANETYGTPRCDWCAPCKGVYACPTYAKPVMKMHYSQLDLGLPLLKPFSCQTSYPSRCVDMEGAWSPLCLTTGTQKQGMCLKSSPEGPELSDVVRLPVALHHVLPFPASRTSKFYISIWHAGS